MSHPPGPPGKRTARAEALLRKAALAYPEAVEDFPWGHRAIKVRGKIFLILAAGSDGLGVTAKLTESRFEALALPFAEPTGYGLGKSGWVSARFSPKDAVPMPLLEEWIEESYRAVAPKRLVRALDGGQTSEASKRR